MKLREARLKAGLKQSDLADRINISQISISNWESGRSAPNEQQIQALSEVLPEVDYEAEFEPLDATEKKAALQFAGYLKSEVSEDSAIKLIFNASNYDIRQILKHNQYLPEDHKSGDDLLLPPELMRERRVREKK